MRWSLPSLCCFHLYAIKGYINLGTQVRGDMAVRGLSYVILGSHVLPDTLQPGTQHLLNDLWSTGACISNFKFPRI